MIGGVPVVCGGIVRKPRDAAAWTETAISRSSMQQEQQFHLPREREIVNQVLTAYFTDLSPYRPIFNETDVHEKIDVLYSSISSNADVRAGIASSRHHDVTDDSGFLCCVYRIFALGTLSVENRRICQAERVEENWLSHEEFYDLALALKPDLQNSISTLQARLILHWYLFIKRHGKALWRLVGNMVHLAIELGLHHNPREQGDTFTPEECQLRMRLWLICLVHDRETSIIFGQPLAVQRADLNAPPPTHFPPS